MIKTYEFPHHVDFLNHQELVAALSHTSAVFESASGSGYLSTDGVRHCVEALDMLKQFILTLPASRAVKPRIPEAVATEEEIAAPPVFDLIEDQPMTMIDDETTATDKADPQGAETETKPDSAEIETESTDDSTDNDTPSDKSVDKSEDKESKPDSGRSKKPKK